MNAPFRRTAAVALAAATCACGAREFRSGAEIEPLRAFDRAADGTLFAVGAETLYRSRDRGGTWEALARSDRLRGVRVSTDGSSALVIADRSLYSWSEGEGMEAISPSEAGLWSFTVWIREGNLWLATGLEIAEDEETQELIWTRDVRQVGPGLRTHVFVSLDEGRSWTHAAEHTGSVAQAAWFGADRWLRLCFSDGTIRGARVDERGGIEGSALALISPAGRELGGQLTSWILFSDATTGWVGGRWCLGPPSLARTDDGGRSWLALEAADEWIQAFRLGGGTCLRVVGIGHPGTRVELVRGAGFEELRRFESAVREAQLDAGGCLLLRLADGEVWSLSRDGREWSRVGMVSTGKT